MKKLFLTCALSLLVATCVQAKRFVPKSDLIRTVLNHVNSMYVDHNRIIPGKMLEGALERLSVNIAPVLTRFKSTSKRVYITVSVDEYSREFEFPKPQNVIELNRILQKIVRFIKARLEKGEKLESVDYAVINGFLRKLDPHSSLLIPEIYQDFSTQTSGNFGGVGMMIGLRKGNLTIIAPIDGTPASRSGLRAKDHIVQINEESTINMSLTDAVKKLRGKAGTKVDIYLMRKGLSSPKKVTITRAIIKITSVESYVFKENGKRVGFLKINTFQRNTINEVNSHLEKLDYDLKDFYGLIIDLRNNPGGLLNQAIEVSDRFLSRGVIVSTAGVSSTKVNSFSAHWFRSITDLPLIVLINNGSASASEIVTAALKKNKRAVVLGIQTFGKGSVQQVIPFRGGSALRLTTSKYLTPGNISIQSVGVAPNIAVTPYYVSEDFLHITSPKLDKGENSLDQNFAEWGDKGEQPEKTIFYLYEGLKEKDDTLELEHKELKYKRLKEDFLVQTSVKILVKNQKREYDHLLKTALSCVEKEKSTQERKLIKKLLSLSHKIDWTPHKTVKGGRINSKTWIGIKVKKGKKESWEKITGPVPADSEIRLHVKAANIGDTRISRLMAITESEDRIFDDRQFAFGKLDPGETKEWAIPIKISKSILSRDDLIVISFSDQEKRNLHTSLFSVRLKQKKQPEFHYVISTFENGKFNSKGNGDGIFQKGETIVVKIDITNKGEGTSGPLTVLLKNGEGENIFLKKGRERQEELPINNSRAAYFQFDLKDIPKDQDLDFSLDIIDSTFFYSSLNQKIKFPVTKANSTLSNTPPSIRIQSTSLLTTTKSYNLKGVIEDEKGVKDMYIFNNKKKVFYKNFMTRQKRNSVTFRLKLKLEDRSNRIVVISRDDENVISQKILIVRSSAFK